MTIQRLQLANSSLQPLYSQDLYVFIANSACMHVSAHACVYQLRYRINVRYLLGYIVLRLTVPLMHACMHHANVRYLCTVPLLQQKKARLREQAQGTMVGWLVFTCSWKPTCNTGPPLSYRLFFTFFSVYLLALRARSFTRSNSGPMTHSVTHRRQPTSSRYGYPRLVSKPLKRSIVVVMQLSMPVNSIQYRQNIVHS